MKILVYSVFKNNITVWKLVNLIYKLVFNRLYFWSFFRALYIYEIGSLRFLTKDISFDLSYCYIHCVSTNGVVKNSVIFYHFFFLVFDL